MGSLVDPPAVLTAAADYPEVCIEWLPTVGPWVAEGDWADISAYVQGGETFVGRQYELERFQAGTLSLTLRATSRLFDPDNAAGPWYGMLVPMRQIRISAVWNGTRYPVWRGYITSWGQTVPADKVFITTIEARDAFAVLELVQLPSSAWALEVQRDNPSMWLRLGETDTSRVTDSSSGGNYGIANCVQGADGLVVNDSDGAFQFAHSLEERVYIQNPSLISGYPFTISGMFKIDNTDPAGLKVLFLGIAGTPGVSANGLGIYVDNGSVRTAGQFIVSVYDGTNRRRIATDQNYDDNLAHHFMWVASSSSSFTVYIDGTAVSQTVLSSANPTWPGPMPNGYTLGNYHDLVTGDYGFGSNAGGVSTEVNRGTIDEVCVWDGSALGSDRAAAHSLAAKSGWEGDDTGERAGRFLDAIGWPTTLRDLETGISILGPASWSAGASALEVLQAWADTEYGAFFVTPEGKLSWHSRHHPLLDSTATTSQATFGDGHSAATLKYVSDGFEMPRDETRIRNPVIASRAGGVSVTVRDATYETKYGTRSWSSPTTQDQYDAAVRDRATWLLNRYKELGSRATFTIVPRKDPSNLWPQALGRAIGERVTVKRTPLGLNAETSVDQIIEGIRHRFGPRDWSTTFHCSPVDPNVNTYIILDDANYGKLDTGKLGY